MKSKSHQVTVTVRFDKAITRSEAVKEFADVIWGEFYPGAFSEAGAMRVQAVKSASARRGPMPERINK